MREGEGGGEGVYVATTTFIGLVVYWAKMEISVFSIELGYKVE